MGLTRRQVIILLLIKRRERRRKVEAMKTKRMWVRQVYTERKEKGEYCSLIKEIQFFDEMLFYQQFRMTPQKYEHLLTLVAPRITKSQMKREAISPGERLSVTLRYLVTGDAQTTIAASYRMSKTSVHRIIKETTRVIWDELLKAGFLKVPSNEDEWRSIAYEFEQKWNFPNCVGAIDGKHVVMQAPASSGSYYFNYKKTHSIVLMAVVNANYEFTMVDIGDSGRQSDGGVFAASKLGFAMDNDQLGLPKPRILPGTTTYFPYVFLGDEAFPLKTYLIKPYARHASGIEEQITNYRISRARRQVENVFGICASRFRIFRRPIIGDVETVVSVTKAVVALHNFLMHGRKFGEDNSYCPHGYAEGEWRNDENQTEGILPIGNAASHNYSRDARQVRDNFKIYFNSEAGAVQWQNERIQRTADPFDRS